MMLAEVHDRFPAPDFSSQLLMPYSLVAVEVCFCTTQSTFPDPLG